MSQMVKSQKRGLWVGSFVLAAGGRGTVESKLGGEHPGVGSGWVVAEQPVNNRLGLVEPFRLRKRRRLGERRSRPEYNPEKSEERRDRQRGRDQDGKRPTAHRDSPSTFLASILGSISRCV